MLKKIRHWLYRWNWLKRYQSIDSYRYLKRLASGKDSDGGEYFSDKDQAQFTAGGEILVRFPFRGQYCQMYCRPNSHIEAGLVRHSEHSMRLQHIIAEYLHEGVFVDVGANVGTFSIPLAKGFPRSLVVAFEPNPSAHERFVRNMRLNAVSNIQLRIEGVGEDEGEFTLYAFSGLDMGQSSFLPPTHDQDLPMEITVPVVTLDNALEEIDRKIDVIKIDVQGKEISVLRGGKATIEKQRPLILLEHEDCNFSDPETARTARASLKEFFSAVRYDVFYITRKDVNLLFPVRWESSLNGDLLAIPRTVC